MMDYVGGAEIQRLGHATSTVAATRTIKEIVKTKRIQMVTNNVNGRTPILPMVGASNSPRRIPAETRSWW